MNHRVGVRDGECYLKDQESASRKLGYKEKRYF